MPIDGKNFDVDCKGLTTDAVNLIWQDNLLRDDLISTPRTITETSCYFLWFKRLSGHIWIILAIS